MQVVEEEGTGKFLLGISEIMGHRGYLDKRLGVFLSEARVKNFKVIIPRLPS